LRGITCYYINYLPASQYISGESFLPFLRRGSGGSSCA
jgi:hypothetical protein